MVNQAYAHQLSEVRGFQANSSELKEGIDELRQACAEFKRIADQLSVKGLYRKSMRLSQIMTPYAK